jgi:hypothetical protein
MAIPFGEQQKTEPALIQKSLQSKKAEFQSLINATLRDVISHSF